MSFSLLLSVVLATVPAAERKLIDRVVAVVNDEIITWSELETPAIQFMEENANEEKRKATLKSLLDQLISDKLVSQEVQKANIEVGDEEVDRAIKDILR